MLGLQRSRHVGAGLEFNQYRSYEPGDDPHRIDWKLFARSDRYYIRESEVETSISVRFILDATASMQHEEDGLSKFDYARFLIASLGYLAYQQGDAIGLQVIQDQKMVDLRSRHVPQHLHMFLHQLEELQPKGSWPSAEQLANGIASDTRKSVVVFVSDMHEFNGEIQDVLMELKTQKHDLLLFHLLGNHEQSFDYAGRVTFVDLETGQRVQCNTESARDAFLEAQSRSVDALQHSLYERDIAYEQLSIDQPLDFALRQFLSRRARMSM